jgi:hypothetical protein
LSLFPESYRSTWGRTCRSCDPATRYGRHGLQSRGGAICSVSLPGSSGSSETETATSRNSGGVRSASLRPRRATAGGTRHVSAGSMWTVDIHPQCAAVHTGEGEAPIKEDPVASVNPSVRDDTPSGDRWHRARGLVALAACRREPLERMRAGYQRRLHAASDDFDATDALRVVELALSVVGRSDGPWTAQSREAHAPGPWWRRRRNR